MTAAVAGVLAVSGCFDARFSPESPGPRIAQRVVGQQPPPDRFQYHAGTLGTFDVQAGHVHFRGRLGRSEVPPQAHDQSWDAIEAGRDDRRGVGVGQEEEQVSVARCFE